MKLLRRFALVAVLLGIGSLSLFAENDPPSRVARLTYTSGKISVQPGGVEEWVAASVNRPLTTSDRIWADKDSRAELNLGTASIRINDETSLGLSNVSDSSVQLEVFQGTLNLRVAHLFPGEIYEVDTPNMAFTVLKSGNYRFDVDSANDATYVTVWKGEGEATGNGPAVRVRHEERMRFSGDRTLVHIRSVLPPRDGFDDWCLVRDRRMDSARSLRYVARGVIGYEDLDGYGTWDYYSPYGYIWTPVVGVGWAPYRYGHWIWVAPWGWTWVDDAPWGFAPFHYGRWVYYRSRWGWCPGPVYARPYYAPALVAWVGGGSWSIGFGFGPSLGWFPLGWGDPYIPYYRASRGYFHNVNITNTRITNITYITNNYYGNDRAPRWRYRNEQIHDAVTVVPRDTLVNSRRVDRDALPLGRDQLKQAALVRDPDLRPGRNSVLGLHADTAEATPRTIVDHRQVVSRMTPPPARERFTFGENVAQPTSRVAQPPSAVAPATQRSPDRTVVDRAPMRTTETPVNRGPAAHVGDANPATPRAPEDRVARYPRPPERSLGGDARPAATPAEAHIADVPNPRTVPRPPRDGDTPDRTSRWSQPNNAPDRPRPTPQAGENAVPRPPRDLTPERRPSPQPNDNARPQRDYNPDRMTPHNVPVPRPPEQSDVVRMPARGRDVPSVAPTPRNVPEPPPSWRQQQPSAPPREAPPAIRSDSSPGGGARGYREPPAARAPSSPERSAPRVQAPPSEPRASAPASQPKASAPQSSRGDRGGSKDPHD